MNNLRRERICTLNFWTNKCYCMNIYVKFVRVMHEYINATKAKNVFRANLMQVGVATSGLHRKKRCWASRWQSAARGWRRSDQHERRLLICPKDRFMINSRVLAEEVHRNRSRRASQSQCVEVTPVSWSPYPVLKKTLLQSGSETHHPLLCVSNTLTTCMLISALFDIYRKEFQA